jgi:hypothetical protein
MFTAEVERSLDLYLYSTMTTLPFKVKGAIKLPFLVTSLKEGQTFTYTVHCITSLSQVKAAAAWC